jgi:putative hemolysin
MELVVVIIVVLVNGFFALAEFAFVSSRRARLLQKAALGDERARIALRLIDNPGRFLAVVQMGMTLSAVLAGAFSGATFADPLGDWLNEFSWFAPYGAPVAIVVVVVCVSYFTLLFGELVPKQLALAHAEAIALHIARPFAVIARVGTPIAALLDHSVTGALRLFGLRPVSARQVTEEEVRAVIAEGVASGTIRATAQEMIEDVLFLPHRAVRTIMTVRPEVAWLDLGQPKEVLVGKVHECPHPWLLASRGSIDEICGVVHKEDLLNQALDGQPFDIQAVLQPPLVVPEGASILKTLDLFKQTPVHIAVVVDEYGGVEGIVTRTDLLEAIAGDLPDLAEEPDPEVKRLDDGSLIIDAALPIDDAAREIGLSDCPRGDFVTLAGFALLHLDHVPDVGEHFTWSGWRFEVARMEGRRIAQLHVVQVPQST